MALSEAGIPQLALAPTAGSSGPASVARTTVPPATRLEGISTNFKALQIKQPQAFLNYPVTAHSQKSKPDS